MCRQQTLQTRLLTSLTESEDEIASRLDMAREEMDEAAASGVFDYTITNNSLEDAYSEFKGILSRCRCGHACMSWGRGMFKQTFQMG